MNPTRLCLWLSIVFISAVNVYGQQATVKGKVTDAESKEPVPFASVITETGAGAATDFDGNFEFKTSSGSHRIKFSCVSYQDSSITVELADGENTINFKMDKQTQRLAITTVVGGKFEKELGKEIVTVDVLNKDLIANNNAYDMSKAVEKVPGVSIVDGQANIRGGSGWSYGAGSRVLVLVDEIPLLSADAADVKWSFIPTENVEQVEVVKGAASALYGSSALNGVINVRTAWPKNEPYTKITMNTGFYENPRNKGAIWWGRNQPLFGGGNFVHRRKIGSQIDFVIGGNYLGEKSWLQESGSQEVRGTMKFRWRPKKVNGLSMGVNVNAYNGTGSTFFLWNGGDSSMLKPLPGTSSQYNTLRVTVDPFITYFDKHENRYKLNLRYFNARNKNNTGQGSVPVQYFGEFQYMRRIKKIGMDIVAGVTGRIDDVHSPDGSAAGSGSLVGTHRGTNAAVYVQLEQTFFKKLSVAVGGRYEYNKIDTASGGRPVFRAGINYEVGKATFIRASFGQGYRFPTIAEKFVNTNIGGIGIFPNPGLRPETGWSTELGIKQGVKLGNWLGYIDLTGFINQYDNMMEFTFGQFGADTGKLKGLGFSAQNVGKTRIIGGELTMIGQGKLGKLPFTLLAGYTYIDPKSLNWNDPLTLYKPDGTVTEVVGKANNTTYSSTSSSDNNVLKYRFRHTLKVDAQLDFWRFEVGVSVNYTSFMENIDYIFTSKFIQTFEKALDTKAFSGLATYREKNQRGNTDLSLRLAYNVTPKIKILVIGKNLLNQEMMVRPAYISAPRNYAAQLSIEF